MEKLRLIKKVFLFLQKKEKIEAILMIVFMCMGAAIETAALSLLVLLSSSLADFDSIEQEKWYVALLKRNIIDNPNDAVLLITIMIAVTYIIKTAFSFMLNYIQYHFIFVNQYKTQQLFLTKYFRRPYEYFLKNSTSQTLRIISTDIPYIYAMLNSSFCLCLELIVSAFIFLYLVYVSWIATLVIAFVSIILSICIYLFYRTRLINAGEGYKEGGEKLNKWILQGIENIKEIKVLQQEGYILKNTDAFGRIYSESTRKRLFYTSAPKILIEGIVIISLMVFCAIYMRADSEGFLAIIPTMVAMLLASMRLLPSISRMNSYINDMNYMAPFLKSIDETIDEKEIISSEEDSNGCRFTNHNQFEFEEISLSNLFYRYSDSGKYIFSDASINIKKGNTIGIIGKSGAGKTTLVDILIGLLKPEQGKLSIDGKQVEFDYLLGKVGYIPQRVELIEGTIRENIAFGVQPEKIDDELLDKVISDAQLKEFIDELPEGLNTNVGEHGVRVSGGQCQRIGIARALYTNATLLVFDEATSALDDGTENLIVEAINSMKGKITMIIIAHRLKTIENCDYVYEVTDGTLKRV